MNRIKKWPLEVQAFVCNIIFAAILILAVIMIDGGLFMPMYEYSASTLPYTMFMNRAVHEGRLLWNFGLDMGGNVLESFSFYNLGSILSWPMYLIPTSMVAGCMGPYLILKMGLMGMSASHFLKRHLENRGVILLSTLLYVFSGYTFANLIVIYVVDSMVLFPMLLANLEKLVEEKKKGQFLLFVFLSATGNLFMFSSEMVFLGFYLLIRYAGPYLYQVWQSRKKENNACFSIPVNGLETAGRVVAETVLGILLASVIFIPACRNLQQNGIWNDQITARDYMTVLTKDWLLWIKCLFTPSEAMGHFSSVEYANYNNGQAYLPFFGMSFVLAYLLTEKGWLRRVLLFIAVCSVFPIGNRMFLAFYKEDIRLWYFIMVLFFALATGKVLERVEAFHIWKGVLLDSLGVLFLCAMAFLPLWPRMTQWGDEYGRLIYDKKLFLVGVCVVLAANLMLLFLHRFMKKYFLTIVSFFTIAYCMGTFADVMYGYQKIYDQGQVPFYEQAGSYGDNVYTYLTENPLELDMGLLPYRVAYDEGIGYNYYNQALAAGVPTISTSLEMIHPSVRLFYKGLGLNYDHSSREVDEGVRDFLGVKYIYARFPREDMEAIGKEAREYTLASGAPVYVYENEDALPIGCLYDHYLTMSEYSALDEEEKQRALLSCAIVDEQHTWLVENVLEHQTVARDEERDRSVLEGLEGKAVTELATERKENAMEQLAITKKGFSGTVHADQESVLLFSIPYDAFFEAYGDRVWLEVFNSCGLLAVKVPAGDTKLEMVYNYRPVKMGLALSYLGLLFTMVYLKSVEKIVGIFRKKDKS